MKLKFVAAALCAAAGFLFSTGCGEAKSNANTIKIGVSIPAADHGWTGGIVWWAEQAKKSWDKKDPNVRVIISTAKDAAEQVDKIENLLVQKVDALVVLPQEPGPLTSICTKASKQGKYLVVVDRGLTKDVQNVTVAGDNAGFGKAAADALVKQLNGKGDILVMEGIPCPVNSDRVNAFKAEIAKHPGMKILESQSAYWDTEKGLKLMENYLQKYPKIDAVWVGDDDVLLGALKAWQESKRSDIKLIVGGGGSKQIVKRILDGDPVVPLTVTYPPRMIAVGVDYAVAGARKQPLTTEKRVVIPSEIVDKTNASKFYFPDSAY